MEIEDNVNKLEIYDINKPLINSDTDSNSNSNKIEQLERKDPSINSNQEDDKNILPEENKKKSCCKFPSAYTIIIIIEIIVFILTYIIPKGKFWKLEYLEKTKEFKIVFPNETTIIREATEEILKNLSIKVPLEYFKDKKIKRPLSIPYSYEPINATNENFLELFAYPIYGLIQSSNVSFFLLVLGGTINIIIEMKALTAGMAALSRITKGKEFLLLCLVFLIISIGGSTFGMCEETLAFFPILMPIFLRSGMDGMLGMASIFMGSMIGIMFSTVNAFSVVLGSDSAGINFMDNIVFRIVAFVLGDVITIFYLYHYYKKLKLDEKYSIVYDIKQNLEKKYLSKENEKKGEEKGNNDDEKTNLLDGNKNSKNEFTCLQKIALIIFVLGFIVMIIGVAVLGWYFEYMTATFLVCGIILMFFLKKGEQDAIKIFVKGAGDFVGVALIIGFARGINITLENGNIQDTILNGLSKCIEGLPKIVFAILMFIIFIFLGFFIASQSGLAILAMPVFAPLADNVNCSRAVVVNAYMFGQSLTRIISPGGFILIVLELVEIKYSHFIKFIWPLMVILLVYLIILIIINTIIG